MDLITPGHGLLFWQLSGLFYLGFWVYALFDCVRNEFRGPNQKLIWIILLLFAPVIGTFLYLSMSRSSKEKRRFDPDFNKVAKK
ncbi:MAG: PLD nuclease N-terminal domain-containing protein [Algoriphagus sp.]|uniref:PLD nuclease N-terminal domain-containing protein n=1 Tax=Algoriphagus sp. TaxID=1872435 RepID=UPI00272FA8D4|nr:PLD nuclease N-terminal domain-containing protein [Algoriphagus sp.]MDP2041374.1 PLD nuclease N-terminal domain-containing protein [Algoriphagus sp.]MDP3473278.1 PLD nuclease N-terminal domain-containing protein [Algoriphagus sp.]